MEALQCVRVTKSFDGVVALDNVSCALPSTGIMAVIGPNGAGKTTLLNVLTGFIRPESGECYLGEVKMTHMPPYRIARLGIARTFQDLRLIRQVSVLDNILLAFPNQHGEGLLRALTGAGVSREEDQNRVNAMGLLRFVDLEEKALDLADELSYGQQKLLTLACCLATDARILLFDEPVAGVNFQTRSRILQLLRELGNEGKRVLFIEHDIAAVREIADHLMVMDEGRVIAQGPPVEVLRRPEIMEAYVG